MSGFTYFIKCVTLIFIQIYMAIKNNSVFNVRFNNTFDISNETYTYYYTFIFMNSRQNKIKIN